MSEMYTLHGHVRSGNAYKPALMMSLCALPFEFVEVNLPGADITCYCYARLAEEGGFDMAGRPATSAWRARMEALPGWAPPADLMPSA